MTYDEAVTNAAITIYGQIRSLSNRPSQPIIAKMATEEAKNLIDELVASGIKYEPSSQSVTKEEI